MTGFGEAIGLFYKNYVNFEGRASRAEYWWPTLMQIIVYTSLFIVFLIVIGLGELEENGPGAVLAMAVFIIGAVFYLANLLPGIAVKIRRFHDLEQTGWLVLVFWSVNIFVPIAEIGRMIWFAFPGTIGPNQYGLNPYGDVAEVFG